MSGNDNATKVVILGDSGVGKSCLINRFISNYFNENDQIGAVSYHSKVIYVEGKEYKFDIWDTCGVEKYRALQKFFVDNSKIVLLVYDITKKKSFLGLDVWLDMVLDRIGPDVFLVLVGNKSDLYENEEISEEKGREFAQIIKAKFALVSAKDNPESWNSFFKNVLIDYIKKNNP